MRKVSTRINCLGSFESKLFDIKGLVYLILKARLRRAFLY